jgi:hypothetical protein
MASAELVSFYEGLRTEADLGQLCSNHEPETIHLEFKKKKFGNTPELDAGDTRSFSKSLSGFANSDGGVLLWGVGTGKHDHAESLHPIANCVEFAGRLKKSLLNAVQPFVDDVRIEPITRPDGSGFVKCLIPASDKTPHRAMMADREYFKRSTEGFYRLEHFDLEDMFGRRPIPRLELLLPIVPTSSITGGINGERYKGLVVPTIRNAGRGSARAPYLAMSIGGTKAYGFSTFGIDGNGNHGLAPRSTTDRDRLVFASYDVVVHPGVSHEVTGIDVSVTVGHKLRVTRPDDLHLYYEIGAENARLSRGDVIITGNQIARALLRTEDLRNLFPDDGKSGRPSGP